MNIAESSIEIKPLEGIVINGQEIRLGVSENDIKAVFGEPYSVWKNTLYYFKNELGIHLNDGYVEYI